ncbi:MAG: redoxin domain-containing protein [Ardenticatenaceae bacterium]|nr:redoxin domain-containing protein [Ardenticatenaceae bacterium]
MTTPRRAAVGQPIPDFSLPGVDGHIYNTADDRGHILVIDFWSAECPVSERYDPYLQGFADAYGPKGVKLLAVDSNVYDRPRMIKHAIEERKIRFPILRDEGNVVADLYEAVTTPHIFVADAGGILRYRGHIDDTNFRRKEPTINYLEEVVDALLFGNETPVAETSPFGCTINRARV